MTDTPLRRMALVALGWIAAAAGAVTVGMVVVSFLSQGITGGSSQPMSSTEIQQALDQSATENAGDPAESDRPQTGEPTSEATPEPTTPAPSTPEPTTTSTPKPSTTSPSATSAVRGISTLGGDVAARCIKGEAYLVSWSPSPGYEADDESRGPAQRAGVTFEHDDDDANPTVRVTVTCNDSNQPTGRSTLLTDD